MVVDASALAAILFRESDAGTYRSAFAAPEDKLMSAASALECAILFTHRHGAAGIRWLDQFIAVSSIQIVAFDDAQLLIAREAYRRFGRGSHAAALNFGDCFAYALAKQTGEPLLCKGNDFRQTDIAIYGLFSAPSTPRA